MNKNGLTSELQITKNNIASIINLDKEIIVKSVLFLN